MRLFHVLFSLLLFIPQYSSAQAPQTWDLPLIVNDTNTKVQFDVDTTWHIVTGHVSNISGNISLADSTNPLSINSEIHFPVKSFDTGWGMRNESLQDSMHMKKFPEVILKTSEIEGDCNPEKVQTEGKCQMLLVGTLKITDVTREAKIPVTIEAKENNFLVQGKLTFKWTSFNIEDPSILMAKVDPDVTVTYSVSIPATKINEKIE